MATYTITEAMARLKGLPRRVGYRAVEIMKEEITNSTNGPGIPVHLADTVKMEEMANGTITVSTNKYTHGQYGIREVGAIIRKGRPALKPREDHGFKVLHWTDPFGGEHFAKKVGPAEPNEFVGRTLVRLERERWTL